MPAPDDIASPAAAPEAVREPPRIHFSKTSGEKRGQAAQEAVQILWWGLAALAFLAIFVARMLVRAFGWPLASTILLPVGAIVSITCLVIGIRALRRRAALEKGLHEQPDAGCRVRCIGAPEEILEYGSLDPVMFEPAIFSPAIGIARDSMPAKWCVVIVALLLFFGSLAVRFLGSASLFPEGGWIWVFWGGMVAGFAVASWLWPSYYRIVPGRVEIMRFAFRVRQLPRIQRLDLMRSRVLVDLRRWVVIVGEGRAATDFTIRFVPGRRRMAYYILLAAVAERQAPELPKDELVG